MPTSVGPNTFGEENLVFGYDLGDTDNSFKGKSATNYLTTITPQYSDYDLTYFKITNGSHVVDVPQLGRRTVKYVDVWNDYNNGSGNCCLSLFTFGTGIDNVSGNTTYTYQIIYKTDTGYSNTNYVYRYEYGAAGYIREGGLHSTGRRTHLGDGWYHAWGTVTLHPDTTYINTYLFHYEYATKNRVQVAGVMFTEGTEIIPPSQFLEVEETRSNVQGLLDITGNSTIDLANVSFDSNAQMTFDGTDDWINVGQVNSLLGQTAVSLEFIVDMATALDSNDRKVFHYSKAGTTNGVFQVRKGSDNSQLMYQYNSAGTWYTLILPNAITSPDTFNHFIFTHSGTEVRAYKNGEFVTNGIFAAGLDWVDADALYIGYRAAAEYWKGDIPMMKIYSQALTASEIKANYNAIKGRFNI